MCRKKLESCNRYQELGANIACPLCCDKSGRAVDEFEECFGGVIK